MSTSPLLFREDLQPCPLWGNYLVILSIYNDGLKNIMIFDLNVLNMRVGDWVLYCSICPLIALSYYCWSFLMAVYVMR